MAVIEKSYIAARLEAIRQELEELKKGLDHNRTTATPHRKLQGMWEGLVVGEGEIREARNSLFKYADSSEL